MRVETYYNSEVRGNIKKLSNDGIKINFKKMVVINMPMIRCADCGKSISDRAAACPNCGCPVGGSNNSSGNVAFERRIEEYRVNNYKIVKRYDNSVKMAYKGAKGIGFTIFLVIFLMVVGFIGVMRFLFFTSSLVIDIVLMAFGVLGIIGAYRSITAYITITKTGKIEETGALTLDRLNRKLRK